MEYEHLELTFPVILITKSNNEIDIDIRSQTPNTTDLSLHATPKKLK